MVMNPLANLRQLLFLSQDLYAQLLQVSCSLIALVESNRRILRGTPLFRENKLYTQWKDLEDTELIEPPPSPGEVEERQRYLDDLETKLIYKKRKIEEELEECTTVKERARKAIYFYENRNGTSDNGTEALVLGLGYRKAKQEYARMSPTLLLELERKLSSVRAQLGWVKEKRAG